MPADRPRNHRWALGWMVLPFAAYLAVLQHFWFDAPISDDYDIALAEVMRMADVQTLREWIDIVVAQHNEHRIAVVRMAAWLIPQLMGHMDFRVLALVGDLSVPGLCVLAWIMFRDTAAAPLFAAAAFIMMQWSYFEASIMATAALPNIGVVFFASASLLLALRPGRASAAWCVVFALLAVGSQANGLFVLPLAALACALAGRRARAGAFTAVAIALFALYFWHYARPGQHPSPFLALQQPVAAVEFFLLVIGGVLPGRVPAMLAGAGILGALAWLALRGEWKRHPAAALCVAFVLVSAAAVTAGRVGLGVSQSSRYAIYSSWLLALAFLGACATRPQMDRITQAAAVAGSAVFAFAVSWGWWSSASEFSRAGQMLFKALPAGPDVATDAYLYTVHPNPVAVRGILAEAQRRGLYTPHTRLVYAPALQALPAVPGGVRLHGVIDHVTLDAAHVRLSGWSDITATVPQRTFALYPPAPLPLLGRYEVAARPDVAAVLRDARFVASGFVADLEYPSVEEARRAVDTLCVVVAAPGHQPALLHRPDVPCRPAAR